MDLKRYIQSRGIRTMDLAAETGYQAQYLSSLSTGCIKPTRGFARYMEMYTSGEVTYDDMLDFYNWKLEKKRRYKEEEKQKYSCASESTN